MIEWMMVALTWGCAIFGLVVVIKAQLRIRNWRRESARALPAKAQLEALRAVLGEVEADREKAARAELIALLYQDPREWIAEGEARALTEHADEWPTYDPDPEPAEQDPAPRCPKCSWEALHVMEQLEPIGWSLVSECTDCRTERLWARPQRPEPTLPDPGRETVRPLRVYGAECMAGQLPDFYCLCLRCQQLERPSVAGRLIDAGHTFTGLVVMAWTALYRAFERVWDAMMRVLR